MIRNGKQYRTVLALVRKFERDLGRLESVTEPDAIQKAERDALLMHYRELKGELLEYEALRSGQQRVFQVGSLAELPHVLIKARIASGLTQKDLASKLGLDEQQIQRYEATDYASASLSRLLQIAGVLGLQIESVAELNTYAPSLAARLKDVGLVREFLSDRLGIEGPREYAQDADLRSLIRLEKTFRWSDQQLLGGGRLAVEPTAQEAAFKQPGNARNAVSAVYTAYAYYLSVLLLKATSGLPTRAITDPKVIADTITRTYGSMGFSEALKFVWDLGIPVLPLRDPGVFHGACWRVNCRNVIVLKQRTKSPAKWLFDMMHEFCHAVTRPEDADRAAVELVDPVMSGSTAPDEEYANAFAGEVILCGRAEELVNACIDKARGSVERLKAAVQEIAVKQHVDVGSLANYVAFRLSLQRINWWGAAQNLQVTDDPWLVARDELLDRVDLSPLDCGERELLGRALEFD